MTRTDLLSSEGYWIATIQLDLYAQVEAYMKASNMNRTQLAEKLGVSKGYVTQVLNGDFDHKLSKLVELALAIGLVPTVQYKPLDDVLREDEETGNKRKESAELVHA